MLKSKKGKGKHCKHSFMSNRSDFSNRGLTNDSDYNMNIEKNHTVNILFL